MTAENQSLLLEGLGRELPINVSVNDTWDTAREKLYHYINHLIDKDFEKLLLILYRIDVHEDKLRKMLYNNPSTDAGMVIADLIMDRQLLKIKTRQEFLQPAYEIAEEDRW